MLLARQRSDLLEQQLKIPLYNAEGDSCVVIDKWAPAVFVDDAYYELEGFDGWVQSIDLDFMTCEHGDYDDHFEVCANCGATKDQIAAELQVAQS